MGIRWYQKCIALLMVVMLFTGMQPSYGQGDAVFISIAFDQAVATIGRTPKLSIMISNQGTHAIDASGLSCVGEGASMSAAAIDQQPTRIEANETFSTEQFYSADSAGITQVYCQLNATDSETGAQITVTSAVMGVEVLPDTGLYFEVASDVELATVEQTAILTASFGNRGEASFTDVSVSCVELGRSMIFVDIGQGQTTLEPGQSGSVAYQLQAVRPGFAPFACSITATDGSTGEAIRLPAPMVTIEVQ